MTPEVASKIPDTWGLPEADRGWYRRAGLGESLSHCRQVTRHHAKSFYFASFPLPKFKRLAAFTVYTYCRYIDDVIDEVPDGDLAPTEEVLNKELDKILAGEDFQPFAPALRVVHAEFGVPRALWGDLIYGCCLDRRPQKLKTYPELEMYCYYVASVVGLVMSCVFEVRDPNALPQAIEMGIALQLTNILRDIDEDWAKGRCYISEDLLDCFGIDYADLDRRQISDRWRQLMEHEIGRARHFYELGSAGLDAIPDDGSRRCAKIMAQVYAGILSEIEAQDFNPFAGRAFVPTWKKCWIALKG